MKKTLGPATSAARSRTSRSIQRKVARQRLVDLLDPEVPRRRAEALAEGLNIDARRKGDPILVRADARGNLYVYAPSHSAIKHAGSLIGKLYAWAKQKERKYGNVQNAEFHFRREKNRKIRAELRRFEKTKDGLALSCSLKQCAQFRSRVERLDRTIPDDALIPGNWPKMWVGGVYVPIPKSPPVFGQANTRRSR